MKLVLMSQPHLSDLQTTNLTTNVKTPLVIVLHGGLWQCGKCGKRLRMERRSRSRGFVVVYPEGTRRSWNAGGAVVLRRPENSDDVGFSRAIKRVIDTSIDRNALHGRHLEWRRDDLSLRLRRYHFLLLRLASSLFFGGMAAD